jgi:SIT family siderophore-iron:H+ symporter-like MFS transporter
VLATPIILVLWRGTRPSRVHRAELRAAKVQRKSLKTRAIETFWQLDGPGIFLCVAGFGMFLITITLANGPTSEWSDRKSSTRITATM